ncbi:MAG: MFS transporter [Myxococcota bacterium]
MSPAPPDDASRPGSAPLAAPAGEPPPSSRYAHYVLGVLTLMYVFNYLDRWVLSILVEDIKAEFGSSDALMGFLLGPGFAVSYTLLGLPVARLADRHSRRVILSIAFVTWSAMTAVSGAARSMFELAAARIGVGVGEAGGTAPAHSVLADYFPPERRTFAFGVFQQGVSLGQLAGLLAGGWLATAFGWREAFYALGVAGVAGAALLFFTVREPVRGRFDGLAAHGADADATPGIVEVFRYLWQRRSFRGIAIGAGIASFGGTGFGVWMPVLLARVLGVPKLEIGLEFGVAAAASAGVGAIGAGWLTDRLVRRDVRWLMWMPAISVATSLPFLLGQSLAPTADVAIAMAIPSGLLGAGWAPAAYAAVQQLAPPRMRALAASVIVFFITLLGQGLGPQAVGWLNDAFAPRFGDAAIRASMCAVLASYVVAFAALVAGARSLPRDLAAARRT